MSKKHEVRMSSEAMMLEENAIYQEYKAAARRLLIKHKAEDLLPMLGLDNNDNNI